MRIGGFVDISTKDIPSRASMVIFTVGCNFKCEFCHNKYLLQSNMGKELSIDNLLNKVKTNLLINAVSITGGEPTLQLDLLELCRELKNNSYYTSVDTNGSNPDIIRNLLPFIDRIALDLKSPLNERRFQLITNTNVDISSIQNTIQLVNSFKKVQFEIRTTYVENLLLEEDIRSILDKLRDLPFRGNYVLQQYQYSEGVGEAYQEMFKKPEHSTLLKILSSYKDLALPFEIFLRDEIVGYERLKNAVKSID